MTKVKNINPGNKALEFLDKRIKSDEYRGVHHSQHNRFGMNRALTVLTLLNSYSDGGLMAIRTTDLSKRSENLPEEEKYARFCNDANGELGMITQDSMRKNYFVDFHRMGLIERFDKNKERIYPDERRSVKYVSLSKLGKRFVEAQNSLGQYFIYSKAINALLGGAIDIVFHILRDSTIKNQQISLYEYMFFVSAVGVKGDDFGLTVHEAVSLINSYRRLSRTQRKAVVEKLKSWMIPENFQGSKTKKRDFHNWKNATEQVYSLLQQTVYFDIDNKKLRFKMKEGLENAGISMNRSKGEKNKYFARHDVDKKKGFELHHVIPLGWSENAQHFKLLDNWRNMLYIDGYSHARITQAKTSPIKLDFEHKNIKLSDFSENFIFLQYDKNVLYGLKCKGDIKDYNNQQLRNINT